MIFTDIFFLTQAWEPCVLIKSQKLTASKKEQALHGKNYLLVKQNAPPLKLNNLNVVVCIHILYKSKKS